MEKKNRTTMWNVSDTSMPACQYVHPIPAELKKEKDSQAHLVYGLKGIADFLHQSVTTAWRLKKSGKYDAAISQRGRCIITDTDKLLELMRLDRASTHPQYIPYYNNTVL